MSAQAPWISELLFEIGDAASPVAFNSDELPGRRFPRIIGTSLALRRVLDMVRVVAPTGATRPAFTPQTPAAT
jgi:hypothetical protein